MDLKGRTALVTGSARGVGRSIVEACAAAGANVVIHGRREDEDSEAVLAKCRAAGVRATFVAGDLLDAYDDFFVRALEAEPAIDLLVNNAGHHVDCPYLEMTHDRFSRTMRLNVEAPYFLTQKFANHWLAQGTKGRVLMVGSINGRLAEVDSTAYDTSKGAIEMMVKTLCVALAPHGIRVNGMAPGLVRTRATSWIEKNTKKTDWIAYHTPNGEVPHSDVCGRGSVFLLSDGAEHVHGQMLLIDGGMSAWQQPEPQG